MNITDTLINQIDTTLRNLITKPKAHRSSPAQQLQAESTEFGCEKAQALSASLMRVNHVGEICAQALYQGQALTSRSDEVRQKMQQAADEEVDHLSWCEERLNQLDSRPSYLNPLWYTGSLALGIAAGLAGDEWSLGFLAETERQVVAHLEGHLDKLPQEDLASRAIVEQMAIDEAEHAQMAIDNGAAELPKAIKFAMQGAAKIMTTVAAKI